MASCQACRSQNLPPHMKNRMHRKPRWPRRRIDHVLILLGIEHFYAHINHIARREILPFISLTALVDQILKGFIDYIQIGVKQLHIFQSITSRLELNSFTFSNDDTQTDRCEGVRLILKIIGIFALVVGNLIAICPNCDRRTRGITIRSQLILPIFELRLL